MKVTLEHLEDQIAGEFYLNGAAIAGAPHLSIKDPSPLSGLAKLTVCILLTKNGFALVGHSAPADPADFNAEEGRKWARESAINQLWPLEGYVLRDKLHFAASAAAAEVELGDDETE